MSTMFKTILVGLGAAAMMQVSGQTLPSSTPFGLTTRKVKNTEEDSYTSPSSPIVPEYTAVSKDFIEHLIQNHKQDLTGVLLQAAAKKRAIKNPLSSKKLAEASAEREYLKSIPDFSREEKLKMIAAQRAINDERNRQREAESWNALLEKRKARAIKKDEF